VGQTGAPVDTDVLRRGGWVERPVQLYRDEWGIPHVRAHSAHDAFVGQGYVHAMDRLWQMDASRKQMEGRWAEWAGAAGLPADQLARRLHAAGASIRDYQALGTDARAMVDAYTTGVNAYLRTHPAPAEYRLVASEPEPWEGWHCIAAMRQRGYLMGSVWFKLWRAAAVDVVSADDLVKLRYDDGGADRLCRRQAVDREPGGPAPADPRAEHAGRERRYRRREQQLGAGTEPDRHRQAHTCGRPASRLRAAGHVRADASALR
jgi:acyl-homoserine lactone acylase PvdQ